MHGYISSFNYLGREGQDLLGWQPDLMCTWFERKKSVTPKSIFNKQLIKVNDSYFPKGIPMHSSYQVHVCISELVRMNLKHVFHIS